MAILVYVPSRSFIIKQNFKRTPPNLVWTLRLRSLWLYRNIFILIFLYQQLLLNKSPYLLLNKIVPDLQYLTQYVLIKKLYFILTHVYLKSYMIRVSKGVGYTLIKGVFDFSPVIFKRKRRSVYGVSRPDGYTKYVRRSLHIVK